MRCYWFNKNKGKYNFRLL